MGEDVTGGIIMLECGQCRKPLAFDADQLATATRERVDFDGPRNARGNPFIEILPLCVDCAEEGDHVQASH